MYNQSSSAESPQACFLSQSLNEELIIFWKDTFGLSLY